MLDFHPLSLSDKHWINSYLEKLRDPICDYSFANLFIWKHLFNTACAKEKGFLLIRFCNPFSHHCFYLEPLGEGSLAELIETLKEDIHQKNEILRFMSLSSSFIERLKELDLSNDFFILENRDFANYVYGSKALCTLSEKGLEAKRNHLRRFERLYPNYTSRPLTAEDASLALSLFDQWKRQKEDLSEYSIERQSIETAFAHFSALELEGIILFVDDTAIAFSFGSRLNSNTFCIHAEKANALYQGSFVMINKLMAQTLCERFEFINREEDLGILNLRKAKLSYHPKKMISNFQAFEKESDEMAVWNLWKTCFNDSDEFIFSYLSSYSTPETRVLHYENQKLISMFHVHLFESDWGKVSYLYGLGTEPEYRGKGKAALVIEESLKRSKEANCIAAWVIQENKDFKSWDSTFDFAAVGETVLQFVTPDNFEFGGDDKNDFGLCRLLAPKEYLQKYVDLHPDAKIDFDYHDRIFPEVSGRYQSNHGLITFTPSSSFSKEVLNP
ncbi:MAG TPA: GNAT family N-acetyltransferase, partial [Fibrobacteraceae bacterium]|nr:GNAT family N-acetyltransferase [Fibrobacteraceae bacterium]